MLCNKSSFSSQNRLCWLISIPFFGGSIEKNLLCVKNKLIARYKGLGPFIFFFTPKWSIEGILPTFITFNNALFPLNKSNVGLHTGIFLNNIS